MERILLHVLAASATILWSQTYTQLAVWHEGGNGTTTERQTLVKIPEREFLGAARTGCVQGTIQLIQGKF